MKENRYDDQEFFDRYAEMARSRKGLSGAGEWPVLKEMLPDLQGCRMLDLGCGYGAIGIVLKKLYPNATPYCGCT